MAVSELRKRRRIKKKSIKLRSKILPVFTKPEPDTPTAQKARVTTVPQSTEKALWKRVKVSALLLKNMAAWSNWLSRHPVTVEIAGSSPVVVAWARAPI